MLGNYSHLFCRFFKLIVIYVLTVDKYGSGFGFKNSVYTFEQGAFS